MARAMPISASPAMRPEAKSEPGSCSASAPPFFLATHQASAPPTMIMGQFVIGR